MHKTPTIKSQFVFNGIVYPIEWYEDESFDHLPRELVKQIYAIAFDGHEAILVEYVDAKVNLPGGTIEAGESYHEALVREMREETNTEVISWAPLGYQRVFLQDKSYRYELRVVAAVASQGDFIEDIGGAVTGNKRVKPCHINSHIKYGEVGDRLVTLALAKVKGLYNK